MWPLSELHQPMDKQVGASIMPFLQSPLTILLQPSQVISRLLTASDGLCGTCGVL